MNITNDVFVDSNGKLVVCYRTKKEWVRMRFTTWQAWKFAAQIKLRQLLGLPIIPYTVPAGVEYEAGETLCG